MKTRILFLLITMAAAAVNAQNNTIIKFDTIVRDFGKIKEEKGKVKVIFNFTNTGADTVKLTDVKPACGCMTVDWPSAALKNGEKGSITVTFDPDRRPGKFEKSVYVLTNATISDIILTIKGEVIPKQQTLADSFPITNGNLKMSSQFFQLRNISNKGVKRDSMYVYNAGKVPMNLAFSKVPSYITCKAKPTTLGPKKKGKICISYDAGQKKDYGLLYDYVTMNTNDSLIPDKQLTIAATITDDFSKLTPAKRQDAAKIVFTSEEYHDFGTATQGDTIRYKFEFRNDGKDTLFIRKAQPGVKDCTVKILGKSALAAGESSTISLEFTTNAVVGDDQRRNIQLVTNDPNRPFNFLIVKGNIKAK
jgi:hypothetical protein